jgi:hypothetical protein
LRGSLAGILIGGDDALDAILAGVALQSGED